MFYYLVVSLWDLDYGYGYGLEVMSSAVKKKVFETQPALGFEDEYM